MTRSPLAGKTILVTRPAERSVRLVNLLTNGGASDRRPGDRRCVRPQRGPSAALRDLAAGRYRLARADLAGDDRDARGPARRSARRARRGRGRRRRNGRGVPSLGTSRPRPPPADLHGRGPRPRVPARRGPRPVSARRHRTRRLGGSAPGEGCGAPSASTPIGRSSRGGCRATPRTRFGAGAVDAVTFTSASTVRGFVGALGAVRGLPKVVCIGPVTAAEARPAGSRCTPSPDPHTTDGLVGALERVSLLAAGRQTEQRDEPGRRRVPAGAVRARNPR